MRTIHNSARPRLFAAACLAVTAALGVGGWALAQNAEVLANLKGYGLQQYLNGNRGGSVPARPSYGTPQQYYAPQRSVLQVYQYPYQHALPQSATFNVVPAPQPPAVVATAPTVQQPIVVGATPYVPGQVVQGPVPVASSAPRVAEQPVAVAPAPAVETKPVAFVEAHLPPGADVWIDDTLMFANVQAPAVTMVTPPLEKGKWYTYTARVRWTEDGKWVGQMHTFDIRAGDIHHMEVTPSTAPSVEKEIAAGLAGLSAEDRKAAESQKLCAVQDTIRLGSMGTPVKVTLDGKDVFLCCKACVAAAKKDPEKAKTAAEKNKTAK